MRVTDELLREICDTVKGMLEAHDDVSKERQGVRKGEAVIAGQWKQDKDSDPERVGVLAAPDDVCLVILSKSLAREYGVQDNCAKHAAGGTGEGGASALLGSPPTFQMPSAYDIRAQNGGRDGSGLCIWDPITGRVHCTSTH